MAAFHTIKQLNEPQAMRVKASDSGLPEQIRLRPINTPAGHSRKSRRARNANPQLCAIRSDGQWIGVRSIEDCWKINDEWWRGPGEEIERLYFTVVLDSNQRLTIFHDLVRDEWFRQAE